MDMEVHNYTSSKTITVNIDIYDNAVIDLSKDKSIEIPEIPKRITKFYLNKLSSKAIRLEYKNKSSISMYTELALDKFFNLSLNTLLCIMATILFVVGLVLGNTVIRVTCICVLFTLLNISYTIYCRRNKNDFELMTIIALEFYKNIAKSNCLDYNVNIQNPYIACKEMARFTKLPIKLTVEELKAMKKIYMYFEAYAEENKAYLKYGLNYAKHFLINI